MNASYSTASLMEKYVGPLKNKGPVSNHIPWAKKIADFYNPMFILSFFSNNHFTLMGFTVFYLLFIFIIIII